MRAASQFRFGKNTLSACPNKEEYRKRRNQKKKKGIPGHSASLASHRGTGPKGNTSEASHVVRRANIVTGRPKHMTPVKTVCSILGRSPNPIRHTHTDQRAPTDVRRATGGGHGKATSLSARRPGSWTHGRVRRPRLLETKPPELYPRSRNIIIASELLYCPTVYPARRGAVWLVW